MVASGSSVGSQDSSRLIDKHSGSRATITLYQAPLTRVSRSPQRPPDIIVAVEAILLQIESATAPDAPGGVARFFSMPDSTIIPCPVSPVKLSAVLLAKVSEADEKRRSIYLKTIE